MRGLIEVQWDGESIQVFAEDVRSRGRLVGGAEID